MWGLLIAVVLAGVGGLRLVEWFAIRVGLLIVLVFIDLWYLVFVVGGVMSGMV